MCLSALLHCRLFGCKCGQFCRGSHRRSYSYNCSRLVGNKSDANVYAAKTKTTNKLLQCDMGCGLAVLLVVAADGETTTAFAVNADADAPVADDTSARDDDDCVLMAADDVDVLFFTPIGAHPANRPCLSGLSSQRAQTQRGGWRRLCDGGQRNSELVFLCRVVKRQLCNRDIFCGHFL